MQSSKGLAGHGRVPLVRFWRLCRKATDEKRETARRKDSVEDRPTAPHLPAKHCTVCGGNRSGVSWAAVACNELGYITY